MMVIREMSREECLKVLEGTRLARLACASENQPYVVPVYFAYFRQPNGEACLYGFTTEGQKTGWMRANPLVCVEVDDVKNLNHWVSVIVFGRYEELPDSPAPNIGRPHAQSVYEPEQNSEQLRAFELLSEHITWWEPATTARAASAHRNTGDTFKPIYYKIHIDRVTGHEATPI
jgi:nitroimidazol reductase NimA-like FMN-containing flavoprotein (pyridoxamine 5'-phosphate oxidase superfamily)